MSGVQCRTIQLSPKRIPDALQERVNSVFWLFTFGLQQLGRALTGVLIEVFGIVPTIPALGACLLVLAIATTFNRSVRIAG